MTDQSQSTLVPVMGSTVSDGPVAVHYCGSDGKLSAWIRVLKSSGRRTMPSYYDVLDVSDDAESEEIEAAFRRALASAQSQTETGDAADVASRMRVLVEAYEVLSNPAYRAAYDVKRAKREPFPVPKPVAGSKLFRALKASGSTLVKDVKEQYENDPSIKEDFDRSIQLGRKVARAARFLKFLR